MSSMNENDSNKTDDPFINVLHNNTQHERWTPNDEQLFLKWSGIAFCYNWLHTESSKKYYNYYIRLILFISFLNVVASIAGGTQTIISDVSMRNMLAITVSGLNLIIPIFTSLDKLLKISENREIFNTGANKWDKLYRSIESELSKTQNERLPRKIMYELTKKEFDELIEASPIIGTDIIEKFNKTFKNEKIHKPAICNEYNKIDVNPTPYVTPNKNVVIDMDNTKDINKVKLAFKQSHGRDPTHEELDDIMALEN